MAKAAAIATVRESFGIFNIRPVSRISQRASTLCDETPAGGDRRFLVAMSFHASTRYSSREIRAAGSSRCAQPQRDQRTQPASSVLRADGFPCQKNGRPRNSRRESNYTASGWMESPRASRLPRYGSTEARIRFTARLSPGTCSACSDRAFHCTSTGALEPGRGRIPGFAGEALTRKQEGRQLCEQAQRARPHFHSWRVTAYPRSFCRRLSLYSSELSSPRESMARGGIRRDHVPAGAPAYAHLRFSTLAGRTLHGSPSATAGCSGKCMPAPRRSSWSVGYFFFAFCGTMVSPRASIATSVAIFFSRPLSVFMLFVRNASAKRFMRLKP